jgi:K(+)-stimulated pyrophosphate-energized sodium pump
MFGGKKDFDFEAPLTHLVWMTSAVSIAVTFIASKLLLGDFKDGAGNCATRILVGAVGDHHQLRHGGGAVIPEFTKVFVSTNSRTSRK